MLKNRWFTLIVGLMIGLVVGYVLAELQPVPPAKALLKGRSQASSAADMSSGGAPVGPAARPSADADLEQQAQSLMSMLGNDSKNVDVLRALGNLYYDHSRWPEAANWYERALKIKGDDPNVLTDLAVVYRNLREPKRSLELLDRSLKIDPKHWQALYNKVVVLHFDLHRHEDAMAVLAQLEGLKKENPEIPDLSALKKEISGS